MNQSNSTTLQDAPRDSIDSTVWKRAVALGIFTGLSLACTSLVFKLDRDLGQIIVYPLILIAYVYLFRAFLPRMVLQALLLTLILLIVSYLWTQGNFATRGVSYISKRLVGTSNSNLERLRTEFNWEAEAQNSPKLDTVYRNFDDQSAEAWGKKSYRVLIYAESTHPKLKLFLKELNDPLELTSSGVSFKIKLFPEWISIDPNGVPLDYLTTLTRVLSSLERQNDSLQKLEDLGFAGYAAGLARGIWKSPVPRAAALLLGASSNLAKNQVLSNAELECIRKQLTAVLRKVRVSDSPELVSIALNNLAVATFLLNVRNEPQRAAALARRILVKATKMRSLDGQIVVGAKLATANLFALEGAEFNFRSKNRRVRR